VEDAEDSLQNMSKGIFLKIKMVMVQMIFLKMEEKPSRKEGRSTKSSKNT
jgi:hypothetical protein